LPVIRPRSASANRFSSSHKEVILLRIDAHKICDRLRCDFLPECYMASTEIRERRRTLRYRNLLVRQMVQMKTDKHILQVLVDGGGNINQQDSEGRTAMMYAADRYGADCLSFLIGAKADLSLRDSEGHTALGRLQHGPCYKQIQSLLKQAGAVR
jgi:hypothetical protein